jgi:uncharacterized protein (DUF2147 family)
MTHADKCGGPIFGVERGTVSTSLDVRAWCSLMVNSMRQFLHPIILLFGATVIGGAVAPNPSPEGYWLTERKSGIVEILPCAGGGTLCGKLVWFKIKPDDPNPQGLDLKNPDPARRDQPLCGLIFMYGFQPAEPGSWDGGAVYDPDSGNSYHATMKLRADGTLDLHGYIGISLIGRSEVWTRYTQPLPICPTR